MSARKAKLGSISRGLLTVMGPLAMITMNPAMGVEAVRTGWAFGFVCTYPKPVLSVREFCLGCLRGGWE